MNIEFLETIGFQRGIERNAYLINMEQNPSEAALNGKKVVLFGTSENCFIAERLLEERGVKVWGYADNSFRLRERNLRGRVIREAKDILKDQNIFFIITTTEYSIFQIRLQMLVENIKNYSIFAIVDGNCFRYENGGLHIAYMDAVNCICFESETPETAMPQCPYASSLEGKALLPITNVMRATEWSHRGYVWADDFLIKTGASKMLEIGPGDGLFSYIMLQRHNNLEVMWMMFEEEEKTIKEEFEKHLLKVQNHFHSRVNRTYGLLEIEDDLPAQKYGLIVLTEVFEHFVLNPVTTMIKIKQLLEEEGRILLTTPAWGHQGPYQTWRDIPKYEDIEGMDRYYELMQLGHVYQYEKEELDEIFEEAGLCVEKYAVSDRNNHNYFLKKK